MNARWRKTLFFLLLGALLLAVACSEGGDNGSPTAPPDEARPILTFDTESLPLPAQPERHSLFVIGNDGQGLTELAEAEWISNVRWAPGGGQLTYVERDQDASILSILDIASGAVKELARAGRSSSIDYEWSPIGDFIAVEAEGEISRLRPDGTEVGPIEGRFLAEWSPDGAMLLVFGEPGDGSVEADLRIVNAATLESRVIARPRFGLSGVAHFSPDGSVVSFAERAPQLENAECQLVTSLALYSLADETIERVTEPACEGPTAHSWSEAGNRIAYSRVGLTDTDMNGIRLLDLETGTVEQITRNHFDFGAMWLSNDEVLAVQHSFCTSCDGSPWWVLMTIEGEELATWGITDPAVYRSPEGETIALGSGSDLQLLNARGEQLTTLLDQTPFQFREVQWSPNGQQIAFVRWQGFSSATYAISFEDQSWKGLPAFGFEPAISLDWTQMVSLVGNSVVVRDVQGAEMTVATEATVRPGTLRLSPDGSLVAFQRPADSPGRQQLAVVSVSTGTIELVRDLGRGEQAYMWSPDSEQLLLFEGGRDFNDLTIISISDGEERLVIDGGATSKASWSPDGSHIAYVGADEVRIVSIESGEEVDLLNLEGRSHIGVPAWSPDGEAVAIPSYDFVASETKVELFERDGSLRTEATRPLQLAEGRSFALIYNTNHFPAWSPTGDRIYMNFLSADGLGHGISMLDLDTMEISDLTFTERGEFRHVIMSVSPDGNRLAFRSDWCFGGC